MPDNETPTPTPLTDDQATRITIIICGTILLAFAVRGLFAFLTACAR